MNWTNSDAVSFREFNKTSGGKLLKYLSAQIPKCNGKSIEEVALQAKYKEGFEKVLKEIDDMISFNEGADDSSNGNFTTM